MPKGCAADVCLQQKKNIYVMVPDAVFGFPLKMSLNAIDMASRFQEISETNSSIEVLYCRFRRNNCYNTGINF